MLGACADICQKLASSKSERASLLRHKLHERLVLLMESRDIVVLHCALHALNSLADRCVMCAIGLLVGCKGTPSPQWALIPWSVGHIMLLLFQ